MKRIVIALLLLCLMIITAFTGCSNPDRPSPNDPVTLNMWHNYGGDMQEPMDSLIDEFNSTIGKEKGIIINVTAITSSSEFDNSLTMIINGDPGAPEMPDIFTGYPKMAVQFQEKDMLANLANYFTEKELDAYIDEFINEGRLSDNGLYVFPIAKSTEVLYLNQTLFDRFSAATGADIAELATLEGIARVSKQYYDWTDAQTPDTANDGKNFFSADSWFNIAQVGLTQLDSCIFKDNKLALDNDLYTRIFDTLYTPSVEGGIAIYGAYSSDLSKTGDLLCSTGSSAGILFYGDTITHPDNTVESVEYNILPYPIVEGGKKIAIQRGGGLMVAKSTERAEYAAAEFIKWLTAPTQNMRFISETGYLPVTKEAFEAELPKHIETVTDIRIKKMLTTVFSMYENYEFFTAPTFTDFDSLSKSYKKNYLAVLGEYRDLYLKSSAIDMKDALKTLIEK